MRWSKSKPKATEKNGMTGLPPCWDHHENRGEREGGYMHADTKAKIYPDKNLRRLNEKNKRKKHNSKNLESYKSAKKMKISNF